MRLADGRARGARGSRVAPDYLAVGDGASAVRMPMSPVTAQRIADATGCVLPPATMVDQIHRAADVRLNPRPMSDGSYANWEKRMMTSEFYAEHDRLVDERLGAREGLVSGHKKDVVVSNRLDANPGRVAIYGWHQSSGKPIQGLSTVHENSYADYSHGVRLVAGTMTVDGVEIHADVMSDPVSRLARTRGRSGPGAARVLNGGRRQRAGGVITARDPASRTRPRRDCGSPHASAAGRASTPPPRSRKSRPSAGDTSGIVCANALRFTARSSASRLRLPRSGGHAETGRAHSPAEVAPGLRVSLRVRRSPTSSAFRASPPARAGGFSALIRRRHGASNAPPRASKRPG
jgi:hypothetical protein